MATETNTTGRESDKFMLRFPDGMRDQLKEAARTNGRSMNAEIVARLEASFAHSEVDIHSIELGLRMEELQKSMELNAVIAQLHLMVHSLAAQEKMARRRVDAARRPVTRLQELLERARHDDESLNADRLERELYDEQKWLREVELEHQVLLDGLTDTTRELERMQALPEAKTSPARFLNK